VTGTANIANLTVTSGVFWANGVSALSSGGTSINTTPVFTTVTATGNVTGAYFVGNISTGNIATTGSYGQLTGANLISTVALTTTGTATVANLVTTSGVFWANGVSALSVGVNTTPTFTTVTTTGATTAGNLITTNGVFWSNGVSALSSGGGGVSTTDNTATNASYYPVSASTAGGSTLITSSTKFYFNPSTGVLNATVFNSLSDENQKTNIATIADALAITNGLRGVTFDMAESGKASAGLIAQDVEKYLPQLVDTDAEGRKSLNYNGVIGLLVEAVKDLTQQVEALRARGQ
jgi:hypothetical protein